jgi:predicted DNA-binding protein (MmcQ/YjbR family)
MKDRKEIQEFILSQPDCWLDFPFGPEVEVYKTGPRGSNGDNKKEPKMFALIAAKKDPVNLSLKCEPVLSDVLREKFVSVMPGYHLNKKHWNTIVCSGELSEQELQDLITLSHRLVTEG